jgi:hypothetical protein
MQFPDRRLNHDRPWRVPIPSFFVVRMPMRILFTIPLLALVAAQALAEPGPIVPNPATDDRNQASWADLEAQARIADGDYDGAVQAKQQADTDRRKADRYEMMARTSKR